MAGLSTVIQNMTLVRQRFLGSIYNKFRDHARNIMISSSPQREHEEITANQTRQQEAFQAIVSEIKPLSESVKELTLKIENSNTSFKAGQWVDFFIPGMSTYTGYTITSAPHELFKEKKLKLAIKYSSYPPTLWVHEKCEIGSNVSIRIGGDFFFPNINDNDVDLLLIGGGVGINPLISILSQYFEDDEKNYKGSVSLLFSAQTESELIFRKKLEKWSDDFSLRFSLNLFVTRDSNVNNPKILCSRMTPEHLKLELSKLRKKKVLSYICGPSEMTDETSKTLLDLGLPRSSVLYEQWW